MNGEIQFSIYKLSKELIIKNNDNIDEKTNTKDMLNILINNLENGIRGKHHDTTELFEKEDYIGILVKKKRNPEWHTLIGEMMGLTPKVRNSRIVNESVSFILFRIVNDEIYATTGGSGSQYLTRIKEKSYGKDLTPKMTQLNDMIIKSITEDNISGADLATKRVKKGISSVSQERESNKIPKELSLIVGADFLSELGIEIEEEKKIGVDNGDSIKIRKKLSLDDLTQVLYKLNEIEKREDNYQLGYLVSINQRYKKSDLDNELYENLLRNQNFVEIIPEITDDYLYNSIRYYLEYDGEDIEKNEPMNNTDLWQLIHEINKKPSKASLRNVITKGTIKATDENLKTTMNSRIYDSLRCSLEYDNKTFYLLHGSWYMYDVNKYEIIKDNYLLLYGENEKLLKETNLIKKFGLMNDKVKNETEYNESFKENKSIIVTHPKKLKMVEPCDLIFYDDERLYLMCNKSYMDGIGVRDLEGQINVSANILRTLLDDGNSDLLNEYYDKIDESEKEKITKEDFVDLFKSSRKITYIAGFSENFSQNITSVYSQALLRELAQTLNNNSMDLIIMNYKNW